MLTLFTLTWPCSYIMFESLANKSLVLFNYLCTLFIVIQNHDFNSLSLLTTLRYKFWIHFCLLVFQTYLFNCFQLSTQWLIDVSNLLCPKLNCSYPKPASSVAFLTFVNGSSILLSYSDQKFWRYAWFFSFSHIFYVTSNLLNNNNS